MLKETFRNFTPPIAWKVANALRKRQSNRDDGRLHAYGVEQPPEFYDRSSNVNQHWRQHYTTSHYYPLWAVVADRLRRTGAERVLDIGCGPGQVAQLLFDKGVSSYVGLDFSPRRIARARQVCPDFRFEAVDVFETESLRDRVYDCVLIMEFLEHVEQDLGVLGLLTSGSHIIATVPNFPSAGHVRHFESARDVETRYKRRFSSLDVMEHLASEKGKKYFLIEGVLY